VDDDVARPTERPVTPQISATATIQALFLFDSNRLSRGHRVCLPLPTEADLSGEGASGTVGAAMSPPGLPSTGGPDVSLNPG
jgi:hypothetical protein